MGTFVAIRGWLEGDEQQLAAIHSVISAHDDGHYSLGWVTPTAQIGWNYRIFYAADLRASAVESFLMQVREIAALPASDADDDRVTGLFFADHETDGLTEWHVHGGQVCVLPSDERFGYLHE